MLRCVILVAYFAGALGDFSSTDSCEYIEKAIMVPATLDEIAGSWYNMKPIIKLDQAGCDNIELEENLILTISKQHHKCVLNYGTVESIEGEVIQDATNVRLKFNTAKGPVWIIKVGVDFSKVALSVACIEKEHVTTNSDHAKSMVQVGILSRTPTLSNEEKKMLNEKMKSMQHLAVQKIRPYCTTSDAVEVNSLTGKSFDTEAARP